MEQPADTPRSARPEMSRETRYTALPDYPLIPMRTIHDLDPPNLIDTEMFRTSK